MLTILFVLIVIASANIIEKRTGFEIAEKKFSVPLDVYGALVLKEPVHRWVDRHYLGETLSSIGFYYGNTKNYVISVKIAFWAYAQKLAYPYKYGIEKEQLTSHIKEVMSAKNEKIPGYFTKGDLDITEKCLKKVDFLELNDEFSFYYINLQQKIHFFYNGVEIQSEPMSIDSFTRFYNLMKERFEKD